MFYLLYLCLFSYSAIQHTLCCGFCFGCPRHVFCVPNVANFSGLFLFSLSSSCLMCTQCCQFLWIVFVFFVFVLSLVYPMLPISLDCFCFLCLRLVYPMLSVSLDCFCFVCLRLVSCVPNVANFSGLFSLDCLFDIL